MRIHIDFENPHTAWQLALFLESSHEDWSCQASAEDCDLWIAENPVSLHRLPHYPLAVLADKADPLADGVLTAAEDPVTLLEGLRYQIPRRYPFDQGLAQGEAFLRRLGMDDRLGGFRCLKWLIAGVLANGALLDRVTRQLYPRAAQALSLTPGAVEKQVRHAIESLWSHGDLAILESCFGQSVDPERGKPTNREFLAMAREHCRMESACETTKNVLA